MSTFMKLTLALGFTGLVAACGNPEPEPVYTPAPAPATVEAEPTYSKY